MCLTGSHDGALDGSAFSLRDRFWNPGREKLGNLS